MRLTCPECGAEYEAPESEIPVEGRHVQCTACHTRWFARKAVAEEVSEDEILTRLESRRPHLRAVPDAEVSEEDAGDFEWEGVGSTEAEPETPPGSVPSDLPPFPGSSAIPQPRAVPEPAPEAPVRAAGPARSDANETRRLDLTDAAMQSPETTRKERSGFTRGVVIGLALILAALLIYLLARPVAGAVPFLGSYVALIDGVRETLAFATQS